jgi:hypothetical protein
LSARAKLLPYLEECAHVAAAGATTPILLVGRLGSPESTRSQSQDVGPVSDASPSRALIEQLPLEQLIRIDVAVETGTWRKAVRTIWTREAGFLGVPDSRYESFEPSIEFVFPDHWIGLRCSRQSGGQRVLDLDVLHEVIELLERKKPDRGGEGA